MPFKNPHPLYSVWTGMRRRCNNSSAKQFADYGGRGIRVCERWNSFATFVSDMGPRPDGYTIERIDNEKGYGPDNCRWASRQEQQRNRRVSVYVIVDGVRHLAVALSNISGLKTDTIIERAKAGLTYAEIMSPDRRVYTAGLALGGKASGAKKQEATHCKKGHEFSEENTSFSKEGWRRCKACHRDKMRRLNAAKR